MLPLFRVTPEVGRTFIPDQVIVEGRPPLFGLAAKTVIVMVVVVGVTTCVCEPGDVPRSVVWAAVPPVTVAVTELVVLNSNPDGALRIMVPVVGTPIVFFVVSAIAGPVRDV